MQGKIAAYFVVAILATATLSAYAGMILSPGRTTTQTATTTQTSTSQEKVQFFTTTLTQNGTVVVRTATVTSTVPGASSLATTTVTASGAPTTTTVTSFACGAGSRPMVVNGSTYCSIDISGDTVVGNPGYSYFLNESVVFMGVRFSTWCPPVYVGCPIPPNTAVPSTQITVSAGAMRFNMTFPDGTTEIRGDVVGDARMLLLLSSHANPRAGMLIQSSPIGGYNVFLLVDYTSPVRSVVTTCSVTGEGAIYLRLSPDIAGQSIYPYSLNATESYGCGSQLLTWPVLDFIPEQGGWLLPVLPSGAAMAGSLYVSVQFSGKTYHYTASISPIQVTCVSIRLPSGNATADKFPIGNGPLSSCLSH